MARNGEYDRSSIFTYSLNSSRVTTAIRDHTDYEGDQKPGRRWFEQSHESRVTGLNRTKKIKVLEYGLYLWLCGYECSSGSESHQGKVKNHIRHLVRPRSKCTGIVIGHLYGSSCKAKFKIPVHPVGLG